MPKCQYNMTGGGIMLMRHDMSHDMRKIVFCICENKGTDQLHGNLAAVQLLCFSCIDSTIPLLPNPKFQASSHLLWLYSPLFVGPGSEKHTQNDVIIWNNFQMSLVKRKPTFCICKNKDADQLHGKSQSWSVPLFFCYIYRVLRKFEDIIQKYTEYLKR